jgi:hypothetical protein
MAEPVDDFRRRVELLENQQQLQGRDQDRLAELLRDNVATSARLNEILMELRDEFKTQRTEFRELKKFETEIEKLKMAFGAIKWLGMLIGTLCITGIAATWLKVPTL